jgi:SAM-dependent methyltransferase
MYETTRWLMQLIDDVEAPRAGERLLDVACGAGANCFHMARRWPQARVTGVDLDDELLTIARERVPGELAERCGYERADMFALPDRFPGRPFAYVSLMQTLLLCPIDEYAKLLRSLFAVSQRWVVLSSLFNDKRMDVETHIRDYVRYGDDTRQEHIYTNLCTKRFRETCLGLGARDVIFRDFDIGIDLAGPAEGGLGTYTRRLEDGGRLQFSGAVYMPWKFAAIRLG